MSRKAAWEVAVLAVLAVGWLPVVVQGGGGYIHYRTSIGFVTGTTEP